MGKKRRSGSDQPTVRPKSDETDDKEQELKQRRHTEGDVTRDVRRSHVSSMGIAARVTRGAIALEKANSKSRMLNMSVRGAMKRKRLMKKWKFAVHFGLLLKRWWRVHCQTEVSQTHPFYMQYRMISDLTEEVTDSAMEFKASYFKANKQMKMSSESVRILTMDPKLRTKEEVHYAIIALRGIDCIADYPLRMQENLARHGVFQSYGSKRIIVKQGHAPLFFYFILYGTVVVATLETGEPYAKTRVTLRRGENFGELAIAHRIPRQSTVLTMEYTEFLTIDCDTYENIFMAGGVKTIHDPDHNKFMKSLYFLRDWPLEKLQDAPKALEFCYFRRNTVLVKDSNMSDWLYIVKSGSLRVYKKLKKCYPCVNKRTGNHAVRAHVDGYHCFMGHESDYQRYTLYNNISIPAPLCHTSDSEDDDNNVLKTVADSNHNNNTNTLALPLMNRVERLLRPQTADGAVIATGHSIHGQYTTSRYINSAKGDRLQTGRLKQTKMRSKTPTPTPVASYANATPDIRLDLSSMTSLTEGQGGKRTLMDDFESSARIKKEITAADLDPEFVLVQTLTKGQSFGVQHALLEDQPSLILVSGGAECVMLNKKFFKEHIDPNTIQDLKQLISPYPKDKDLQNNLQTRVDWLSYKKITLNNLMTAQPKHRHLKGRALVFK